MLVAGCTAGESSTDSATEGGPTDPYGDAETGETGVQAEPSASLSGRIIDVEGAALSGLQMRLCMDSCVTAGTEDDGSFSFSRIDVGTHTLQAVSFSDPLHSTPHALITVQDGDERVLADWVLPPFLSWEALESSSNVELDGGLTLAADPTGLSTGPYSASSDAFIAAVRVIPATSGLPLDELNCSPSALWYLGNYDLQIDPAWPLNETVIPDLPSGIYTLKTADNDTQSWREEGTISVDSKGNALLLSGGISQLTTLALCSTQEENE